MVVITSSQVDTLGISDSGFDRGSLATGTDTAMLSDEVTPTVGPAPPPTVAPVELVGISDDGQRFDYAEADSDTLGLSDAATASVGGVVARTRSDALAGSDAGYWIGVVETLVGSMGLSDTVSVVKSNLFGLVEDIASLTDVATGALSFVDIGDRVDLTLKVGASRLHDVLSVGPSRGGETVGVGQSRGNDMEVGPSRGGSVDVGASQTDRTMKE